MHVVETGVTGPGVGADGHPGVKPTAFVSPDGRTLVVHVVNAQDKEASISLRLTGKLATVTTTARSRTSAQEDAAALPALKQVAGGFADTLPARSMVTYRFAAPSK